MSTPISIANNTANARFSDFPGDIPFNPDDAEIISDDAFVNIAIPEKKPKAQASAKKPKAKMVLKLKGQTIDPVETQVVPDAKSQASAPARKPKSKMVLKELPKLNLKGLEHSKSQKTDPVETQAVPDVKPQAQAPARKSKSKMVLKLKDRNHPEHKAQVSPDPVPPECVITNDDVPYADDPDQDDPFGNAACLSASQEYGEYADGPDTTLPVAFKQLIQKIGNKKYKATLELLAPFYLNELIRKAFIDAGYESLVKSRILIDTELLLENPMSEDEQEHVLNEIYSMVKTMHQEISIPFTDDKTRIQFGTDRCISMASMSYEELREYGRKLGKMRLKTRANLVRTNIRRIIGFHGADPVQDEFEEDEADELEKVPTCVDDETGEIIHTRLDSREFKKKNSAIRDKTITDCLDDSCINELELTRLMFVGTLPGEYHGGSAVEKAYAEVRRRFNRIRAMLSERNVTLYGTYTLELHHDETPHLQSTLYCESGDEDTISEICQRYFPKAGNRNDTDHQDQGDRDTDHQGGSKGNTKESGKLTCKGGSKEYSKKTMQTGGNTGGSANDMKPQKTGFIGLRRNIKTVFDTIYCNKIRNQDNITDLTNDRIQKIHRLMKLREKRSLWLFWMNGFKDAELNREYDDLIDDAVPVAGEHQEMNELDDPEDINRERKQEQTSETDQIIDVMGKIKCVIGDNHTSVFMNGQIIAKCPQITGKIAVPSEAHMDRNGNVTVWFSFKDDGNDHGNDPDDNNGNGLGAKPQSDDDKNGNGCSKSQMNQWGGMDSESHQRMRPNAFSLESAEICEKNGKNKSYLEGCQERTCARERNPDVPPDNPKPDGGWQSVPVLASRTMPESHVRSPERAIRQTQGVIHMKPREPKQKLKFGRPAIFKVNGMFMTGTGAEMKEYRQHRS